MKNIFLFGLLIVASLGQIFAQQIPAIRLYYGAVSATAGTTTLHIFAQAEGNSDLEIQGLTLGVRFAENAKLKPNSIKAAATDWWGAQWEASLVLPDTLYHEMGRFTQKWMYTHAGGALSPVSIPGKLGQKVLIMQVTFDQRGGDHFLLEDNWLDQQAVFWGSCGTLIPYTTEQIVVDETLPVEYGQFDVFLTSEQHVQLNWGTLTETGNQEFVIEKAWEQSEFQVIGSVAGAGYAQQPNYYEFTDFAPLAGNNYYRLKQVDIDGQFAYSDIRTVFLEAQAADPSIYPNPVGDNLMLHWQHALQETQTIEIYDVMGRVMTKDQITVSGKEGTLSVASLLPGPYIVRIICPNGQQHERKFIKK
ncbi:MAG: T9SS type A sorting domain-containing protein [Bacteroidota bacterium]